MSLFLQVCRTIHSWLGAFVMPWVIAIGATGLYLNHSEWFLSYLPRNELFKDQLESRPISENIAIEEAKRLGKSIWSHDPIQEMRWANFRDQRSISIKKQSGFIILSISTQHYYVKTKNSLKLYSPDGELVHVEYDWDNILELIHRSGWYNNSLGTVLADVVAAAMIFFGLSGMLMWSVPKIRRMRRRITNH